MRVKDRGNLGPYLRTAWHVLLLRVMTLGQLKCTSMAWQSC
jgi:hypothetical protein